MVFAGSMRRAGRYIAAAGAVALMVSGLVATWIYTLPPQPNIFELQSVKGPVSDYQPGGSACDPKRLAAIPPSERKRGLDRCVEARESHRIEQENLTQQIRSTNISEWNLRISYAQARLSFVQGILTVLAATAAIVAAGAAIAAAIYAKRSADADNAALEDTRRGFEEARKDAAEQSERFERQMAIASQTAEASGKQAALSREAFFLENRPWVGVVGEEMVSFRIIEKKEARARVSFLIHNTGRTPAHDLTIQARLVAEKRPEKTLAEMLRMVEKTDRSGHVDAISLFFPGEKRAMELDVVQPIEFIDFDSLNKDQMIFTLCGYLIYRSSSLEFGKMHASSFAFRIARGGNKGFSWNETGNTYPAQLLQIVRWPGAWMAD